MQIPSDYERDRATDKVFDRVRSERWRQRNELGFDEDFDDDLRLSAWGYLLSLRSARLSHPDPGMVGIDVRAELVEIAAIAVAAIESIDRSDGRMQADPSH